MVMKYTALGALLYGALSAAAYSFDAPANADTRGLFARNDSNGTPPPIRLPSHELMSIDEQPPRLVIYQQTYHARRGDDDPAREEDYHSLRPLIEKNTGVTHVVLAATHVRTLRDKGNGFHGKEIEPLEAAIFLNEHRFNDKRYGQLWKEKEELQEKGVKVLLMIGGAAKGSFKKLSAEDEEDFRMFYDPLLKIIKDYKFDGVDLDVEERMELEDAVRLIRRLRRDMGPDFVISMTPVASALTEPLHKGNSRSSIASHLSGFSYNELHNEVGDDIAFYSLQFYNGWGRAKDTNMYDEIVETWPAEKVVMGILSSTQSGGTGGRENDGDGFISLDKLYQIGIELRKKHPKFGGMMVWELFTADSRNAERALDPTLKADENGRHPTWHFIRTLGLAIRNAKPFNKVRSLFDRSKYRTVLGLVHKYDEPKVPWKSDHFKALLAMGVHHGQANAAMNRSNGDLEGAKKVLFPDGIPSDLR